MRALSNALTQDRLHHAYLFTGTRGVGKTTVARIFAKCLNCESGVVAEPCGQCSACREIAEGRFVDLIEIDAASRTKVEDMRELLDNIQYRPTRARYKVYLIDEVHMLSNSSFNALLKTLEEPPEHVKFLLATTDPQKLPVTVLSRCLQFNLKILPAEKIVAHLRDVLTGEAIAFEEGALWELARAAEGSMRDALSLTDQAIAFGAGSLRAREVADLLGSVDRQRVWQLLEAVLAENKSAVLDMARNLASFAPDYGDLLQSLAECLHRIAVEQIVPEATDNSQGDRARVVDLAGMQPPGFIQLLYQIALLSRRDLALSPDPRIGFEMALLRMLAFAPGSREDVTPGKGRLASSQAPPSAVTPSVQSGSDVASASPPRATPPPVAAGDDAAHGLVPRSADGKLPTAGAQGASAGVSATPEAAAAGGQSEMDSQENAAEGRKVAPVDTQEGPKGEGQISSSDAARHESDVHDSAPLPDWSVLLDELRPTGILRSILRNTVLVELGEGHAILEVDPSQQGVFNPGHQERAAELFSTRFGRAMRVSMRLGQAGGATPQYLAEQRRLAQQRAAEEAIACDPNVNWMLERFAGTIVADSIQPRRNEPATGR